jgi:thiamine pyrophosphokinase
MKKRILIFGNGRLDKKFLREVRAGDYVIGVDRAAFWLLIHGVTPDAAIGDFDSTSKKELKSIKKSIKIIKYFPRKKNQTDMELAMKYADSLTHSEIIVFGATGTRLDHMLATLHMIRKHVLIDENNRMRLIGRGKTIIERTSYRYISILPYTNSISLSLTGFRYNLDRKNLKKESSLGVSNEIIGKKATIEIFSGKAWVIESND